ncbi:MAG: hypothetical protein AAFP97_13015, partial [Pseudomonadota bacterium]
TFEQYHEQSVEAFKAQQKHLFLDVQNEPEDIDVIHEIEGPKTVDVGKDANADAVDPNLGEDTDPHGYEGSTRYSLATSEGSTKGRNATTDALSVRTSVENTRDMLNFQENRTGRAVTLLVNRATGVLQDNALYVGGSIEDTLTYQETEDVGQYSLTSGYPPASKRKYGKKPKLKIKDSSVSLTSTFGSWTTVHVASDYSEMKFPGEKDEYKLSKAYAVVGDLKQSPFYAAFGRKAIDFGNFDSYNSFTRNKGHSYFWAVSNKPVAELGYYKNGWKLVGSATTGGKQLGISIGDEKNSQANYAFNAEKEFLLGKKSAFTVGGGYLHDTIYRDNWKANSAKKDLSKSEPSDKYLKYRNGAMNAYAEYKSAKFDAMVEYTSTLRPWAKEIPQSPEGVNSTELADYPDGSTADFETNNFDKGLSTLVAQVRWKPTINDRRVSVAASGSWGNIGNDKRSISKSGQATIYEDNQQHALSIEYPLNAYFDVGAEYVYNKGFIPYYGKKKPVSNDKTKAHGLNIGVRAQF